MTVGDRFSSSVQFCILYLKLGMDFPLTSRILSESSVFGSSVVAKPDFFFFMLEFGSKSWEEKLKYSLQCTIIVLHIFFTYHVNFGKTSPRTSAHKVITRT